MLDKMNLEQKLCELPIFQYAFLNTGRIVFSERVRKICETDCSMYGKSRSCPPAVGTVEQCREKCLCYPEALVITTAWEVSEADHFEQLQKSRREHQKITRRTAELLKEQAKDVLVLSAEACAYCEKCTWPDGACRYPEQMLPCVESYGILVTDVAEKCGLELLSGRTVCWLSILFYKA